MRALCNSAINASCLTCAAAASLMDLWNTPGVQENLEQSARVFFSNSFQTINLIPALLVGALLLFRKSFFHLVILLV